MKKFRDYLLRIQKEMCPTADPKELVTAVSNVGEAFIDAKTDGIGMLEITKQEYECLIKYFHPILPWNWSGKTIWGIRLVIKKPSIPSIIERIADVGRKADEQMWKVEKIELGKKEFEELIQETRGLGGCGEIFGVKIERAILQDSYFQPFYIIESPKLKNYTRKTNLTK